MELGVTGKEPCREATLSGRGGVKEKVRCGGGPDNGQESSVRGEEMGSRSLSCARRAMRMEGIWDLARERAVGRQPAIAPVAGRCDVAGGARRALGGDGRTTRRWVTGEKRERARCLLSWRREGGIERERCARDLYS